MKVKDQPDLARDPSTGAVQNTNNDAYRVYIAKRDAIIEGRNRMDKIEQDNAEIKSTLAIIMKLLMEKQ